MTALVVLLIVAVIVTTACASFYRGVLMGRQVEREGQTARTDLVVRELRELSETAVTAISEGIKPEVRNPRPVPPPGRSGRVA